MFVIFGLKRIHGVRQRNARNGRQNVDMKKGFFAAHFISYENIPDTIIGYAAGTRIGVRSLVGETITGSGIAVAVRRFRPDCLYRKFVTADRRREEIFGRNGKSKVVTENFTSDVTSVSDVKPETADGPDAVYNMQGMRTDQVEKGINIVRRAGKTMKVLK